VFVCNFQCDNTGKARQLFDALREALRPAASTSRRSARSGKAGAQGGVTRQPTRR
jgi:hypothetical protein